MPKRLTDLRLDEISLVDQPANKGARVALWKRNARDAETETDINSLHENAPDDPAGSPGTPQPSKGEEMTVEELQKKLGELETQVADITKERDDNKSALDALTKAVEKAGLKVEKVDDGSAKVEKVQNDDEYVEFNGEKIAKSAVPASVLKAIEDANERMAKMEAEREAETLRKRADAELPNLKGTADERGVLLKQVDAISDEATRKAVHETLKAADAATKSAFIEVGKTAAGDDVDTPESRLNKMANERASEKGETFEQAFAQVVKTDAGRGALRELRQSQ